MPAVARLGDPVDCGDTIGQGSGNVFVNGLPMTRTASDLTVGHCYSPTTIISSSPTVITNNIEIALVGDAIVPHTCDNDTHGGAVANGSPDVFFGEDGSINPDDIPVTPEEAQAIVEDPVNVANRQAGVSAYDAAAHSVDDEGAPTPEGGIVHHTFTGKQYVKAAVVDNNVRTDPSHPIDISTKPPIVEPANPETPTPIPPKTNVPVGGYNYDDIESHTGSFPGSFQLSPNFTLSMVSTNCTVSHYTIQQQTVAGVTYTPKALVKNLRDLCYNILEPLRTMYPTLMVNSGFRTNPTPINPNKPPTSQHNRGQAVDISFPGLTTDGVAAFERAKAIAGSSLPYDQFIFEQERTIWFHLSYSTAHRRDVRTKPKGVVNPFPGLARV